MLIFFVRCVVPPENMPGCAQMVAHDDSQVPGIACMWLLVVLMIDFRPIPQLPTP